ncbi:diaphanous GTPase-binding domain-containing protein [Ditylenchus destructor]|uniref:Diaphanous GTPase-binding domain-containing protein n=1 Tax=Ditylenchus destructor TaxID=166010 RepID=A0AAD4RBH3_9BILA|nr:diaphanous GTPase-binding domain-containing protein [Ditylenchus destructor]
MMEDFMDRIWSCFQRISTLNEKKPPDRDLNQFDDPKAHAKITVARSLSDDETSRKFLHLNPATLTYDKQHLESAFRDLLGELDLSPEKEKQLNEQSTEKKWLMILEQNTRKDKAQQAATCDGLVRRIQEYVRTFPDKYSLPLAIQKLEGLAISLRTESVSYVQRFIGLNGVTLLVELLNKCRVHGGDYLAVPILGCFRALLNSSVDWTKLCAGLIRNAFGNCWCFGLSTQFQVQAFSSVVFKTFLNPSDRMSCRTNPGRTCEWLAGQFLIFRIRSVCSFADFTIIAVGFLWNEMENSPDPWNSILGLQIEGIVHAGVH